MPAPRPRAASVFGLLNLVFGGIGFLGALGGPPEVDPGTLPVLGELLATPGLRGWLETSQQIGLVTSALTLLLGIALLQMVWWARVGQVWFALAAIALGLVTSYVSLAKIQEAASEVRAAHAPGEELAGPSGEPEDGPAEAGGGGGAAGPAAIEAFVETFRVSVALGTLLNVGYYGLIVFFMTRPGIRAAFDAERAAA